MKCLRCFEHSGPSCPCHLRPKVYKAMGGHGFLYVWTRADHDSSRNIPLWNALGDELIDWIEYVPEPPLEVRLEGKKLLPICKRCSDIKTIDRGPPAGDGPCPECTRYEPFSECPRCGCLDRRTAGCGCACHGETASHF